MARRYDIWFDFGPNYPHDALRTGQNSKHINCSPISQLSKLSKIMAFEDL